MEIKRYPARSAARGVESTSHGMTHCPLSSRRTDRASLPARNTAVRVRPSQSSENSNRALYTLTLPLVMSSRLRRISIFFFAKRVSKFIHLQLSRDSGEIVREGAADTPKYPFLMPVELPPPQTAQRAAAR